jgi:hypothetical protein
VYAYLHIHRGAAERVSFPDGTSTVVGAGRGAEVAQRWIAEHPPPPEPERSPEQIVWDRWNERLDSVLIGARTVERAQKIRAAFVERDPEPPRPTETQPPGHLADPVVSKEDWWLSSLAGEASPLAQGDGYPYDAVALALTRLEESGGWTVTQIDTQRVAVHDANHSSTAIVGASILLHREG